MSNVVVRLWWIASELEVGVHSWSIWSYFLESWGEARLSPLGTSATNWHIVPALDDRRWWVWGSRWNENWQGKPKYSEKTCPSATLSTTNPTWPDLGPNPCRRGGKPSINRLRYGAAILFEVSVPSFIWRNRGKKLKSCQRSLQSDTFSSQMPLIELSLTLIYIQNICTEV
jgi:hypothetical protein